MTTGETRNVPLGQPTVGEAEIEAIRAVFESGWLSGAGPTCVAFEHELAAVVGTSHALATSNCGSALHLGLQVLGAGPGDEVIVADYTFPATGHAVVWTGATPVFADVERETNNIDPASLATKFTERTKAVIVVHLFGLPVDVEAIRKVVPPHVKIIEDAACAAGAELGGVPAGGLGAFVGSLDATWRGLSLTMPLKREVMGLADEVSAQARLVGAANTLLLADGRTTATNTDLAGAETFGKGLRESLRPDMGGVTLTVSIGVTDAATADHSVRGMLHSADLALYAAKRAGRDHVAVAVA